MDLERRPDVNYFFRHDLNRVYGSERSLINMVNNFNANWHLISPHSFPSGIEATHRQTRRIQIPTTSSAIPHPADLIQVIDEIKQHSPDFLLFDQPGPYELTFFLALPPNLRLRSVAFWRSHVNIAHERPLNQPVKNFLRDHRLWPNWEPIYRYFGNHVKLNLVESISVEKSLRQIGVRNPIATVPAAIGREFSPELRFKSEPPIREKYLDQDEIGVLVVGRVSPEKGLDWVLDMYKDLRLRKELPAVDSLYKRINITIVGGANSVYERYRQNLQDQSYIITRDTNHETLVDRVRLIWAGEKSWKELQEYYAAFDIFCMFPPKEGFGRVTIEAMQSGLTVIGRAKSQTTRELLSKRDYPVGILVNSPQQAANEIISLMHDVDRLDRLQANAVVYALTEYTMEKAEASFWNALNSINSS